MNKSIKFANSEVAQQCCDTSMWTNLEITILGNQLSAKYLYWGKEIFLVFVNMYHGYKNMKKWLVDLKVTILLYWKAV